MKNITKALLGLGLLAGAAAPAFAADAYTQDAPITASGFYLRGDAGWSWLHTEGDNSVGVVGGGVGYKFNDNLRTDLRADWAGIGNSDSSFTTVLGNVYFDIPTQTIVTPYLGAGIGYGWAQVSNENDMNGVAFGLMAGVEVSLTDKLSADIGYRYRQILSEDAYDNEALVGLRYSF